MKYKLSLTSSLLCLKAWGYFQKHQKCFDRKHANTGYIEDADIVGKKIWQQVDFYFINSSFAVAHGQTCSVIFDMIPAVLGRTDPNFAFSGPPEVQKQIFVTPGHRSTGGANI